MTSTSTASVTGISMLEGTLGAARRPDACAPASYNLCLCIGPLESGHEASATTRDEA